MLDVVFLDNHLLVVNKPAGLLAQSNETGDADLLTIGKAFLKETFNKPGNVFLGLVHRLDRPTSGLMVLARTSKAASRLSAQFRQHTVDKGYLALVEGEPPPAGHWQDRLEKRDRQSFLVTGKRGKAASLQFQTLATKDGISLVKIDLETGRHHQIRVQFSSRGFPLLGDLRYGAAGTFDGRNLALHCYRLAVNHPTQQDRHTWFAEPPPSWRGFVMAPADLFSDQEAADDR